MAQRIGVAFICVIALDCAFSDYVDELWKVGASIKVAKMAMAAVLYRRLSAGTRRGQ